MPGKSSRDNGKQGGRPSGSLNKATIALQELKATARRMIIEETMPLVRDIVQAQGANAVGISYLVIRDKNGSYVEATNEQQVKAALAAGGDAFRVYTRQPHSQAAAMLLAYAADKPVEPVEVSGRDGTPLVVKWQE